MTQTRINIRAARASDHAMLCRLWDEVDDMHRAARPDLFQKPQGPPRTQDFLNWIIAGPDSTLLVADDAGHGAIVGSVTLRVQMPPEVPILKPRCFLQIDEIIVHSSARRQGIGRQLMDAAAAWGREKGAQDIELSVHSFNTEAVEFYQSLGYDIDKYRMRLSAE